MTFGQRSKVMAQLHILLKRDIDIVLCQDAANDVALNAYAKGIKVMVRDQERLKSDYFKHYHAYDDAQYLRTIKAQKIKRNFSGQ